MNNLLKSLAFYLLVVPSLFVSGGLVIDGSKDSQIRSMSLVKAVLVDTVGFLLIAMIVFIVVISIN